MLLCGSLVALCLWGITLSQQAVLFLAALVSAAFGLLGVVYDYLNRRKLREAKRWSELLRTGGAPNFDDFYKEWKARGLPWPLTSRAEHDERVKIHAMIDDLERKSDSWPLVFTGIATAFAFFAAVLAYLLIP
jgi:hypothetical protein